MSHEGINLQSIGIFINCMGLAILFATWRKDGFVDISHHGVAEGRFVQCFASLLFCWSSMFWLWKIDHMDGWSTEVISLPAAEILSFPAAWTSTLPSNESSVLDGTLTTFSSVSMSCACDIDNMAGWTT